MKLLEQEFVQNSDKRGDNKFVQIKRNEHAAIYRRFTMDGRPMEFEVFEIKVAGGTEIFGRFYEKYEQYPGASAFGKTAWTVLNEDRANQLFEEITRTAISRKNEGNTKPDGKKRRGRVAAIRPAVILPKKKFCMKDLVIANKKGWNQPTLYVELMKMVKQNKVVEAERKQVNPRGRATVFYKVR